MRVRVVKWLCVAELFVAFVFWQGIANYELLFSLIVCCGAAAVAFQSFHSARHRWTIWFLSIPLLFNPAVPFPLANRLDLAMILLAVAAFAVLLTRLKSLPLLSIPSMMECGSE